MGGLPSAAASITRSPGRGAASPAQRGSGSTRTTEDRVPSHPGQSSGSVVRVSHLSRSSESDGLTRGAASSPPGVTSGARGGRDGPSEGAASSAKARLISESHPSALALSTRGPRKRDGPLCGARLAFADAIGLARKRFSARRAFVRRSFGLCRRDWASAKAQARRDGPSCGARGLTWPLQTRSRCLSDAIGLPSQARLGRLSEGGCLPEPWQRRRRRRRLAKCPPVRWARTLAEYVRVSQSVGYARTLAEYGYQDIVVS